MFDFSEKTMSDQYYCNNSTPFLTYLLHLLYLKVLLICLQEAQDTPLPEDDEDL